jgi:nucleoside-diphosphate-sugar epimerase
MRILITGASGFVGTHLLPDLLEDGAQIVALHHRSTSQELPARSSLTWVRSDLTTDSPTPLLAGIDAVIHLAAGFALGTDPRVLNALYPLNVGATDRLAVAASAAGVKRFVLASSIAACEQGDGPIVTEQTGSPVTAYGESKLAAEHALLNRANGRMECVILRATALFGEYHLGSVFELARAIKRGRFLQFGSGANRVNFQYVKDYCDTLRTACCTDGFPSGVYIAADRTISLSELTNLIARMVGTPIPDLHVPASLGIAAGACFDLMSRISGRPMPLSVRRVRAMLRDVEYSARKLDAELQRPARYGVATGLERTVGWFRRQDLL